MYSNRCQQDTEDLFYAEFSRLKYRTGSVFNCMVKGGVKFWKITSGDEKHHGFQYVTGLNIDSVPFSPEDDCLSGLHFTSTEYVTKWSNIYTRDDDMWIRPVTIPDDAKVVVYSNWKIKADRIILGPKQLLLPKLGCFN